jgi:hypothetical protein
MEKLKQFTNKTLTKVRRLTFSQCCSIGALLLALTALIIVRTGMKNTEVIYETTVNTHKETKKVYPTKKYKGDDFDILLKTLLDNKSFLTFDLYNSDDGSEVWYDLEIDTGTLEGISKNDILPEAINICQAGEIHFNTVLDPTPYSYIEGKPETLRQLLWVLQNSSIGFALYVENEYDWKADFTLIVWYDRSMNGFRQEVKHTVRESSPDKLFKEAMEFLNTHANPLWENE